MQRVRLSADAALPIVRLVQYSFVATFHIAFSRYTCMITGDGKPPAVCNTTGS